VLLGAFLLHRLENDKSFGATLNEWLRRELPGFLTRPDDKALFDDLISGGKSSASAATPATPKSKVAAPVPSPAPASAAQPKTAADVLGHRFNEDV